MNAETAQEEKKETPNEEVKENKPDETKADHKETALSDCCHHKWGKSSLLVRCLANPKRFHCAKKDRLWRKKNLSIL